jgi:flagellar basal body-associated protein FliL
VYEDESMEEVSGWRRKYGGVLGILLTLVFVLGLIGLAAYLGWHGEKGAST